MISLITSLFLGSMMGCTQPRLHWYTYRTGGGEIKSSQAPSFPSYCFDGLMKKWQSGGCTKVGYKNISKGFVQFWCSDWRGNTTSPSDPLRANDFWMILWNEQAHQYARTAPDDTTYECGDASALLISAERD